MIQKFEKLSLDEQIAELSKKATGFHFYVNGEAVLLCPLSVPQLT